MANIFNPLYATASDSQPEDDSIKSTSSLMNGVSGQCPKCKQAFGSATVNDDPIYYCEKCRVSQPIPQ